MSELPSQHKDCREWFLRFAFERTGIEMNARALTSDYISNEWTQTLTCPHGVAFVFEPTSEQKIDWIERKVP